MSTLCIFMLTRQNIKGKITKLIVGKQGVFDMLEKKRRKKEIKLEVMRKAIYYSGDNVIAYIYMCAYICLNSYRRMNAESQLLFCKDLVVYIYIYIYIYITISMLSSVNSMSICMSVCVSIHLCSNG